jgi:RNA polymerase sigma-70 factor, ECF subfamily
MVMDSNVTNSTDEQQAIAITQLKHGGNTARLGMATLFRLFQPRVIAYLRRRGADTESADDLCQDLFVKIMEKIHDYRGDARFDAWVFAILRNLWIDKLRVNTSHVELPEDHQISASTFGQLCQIDIAVEIIASRRAITALEAFATADPASAHLLELRIMEGWDYDALATYYNTTPQAMRERISYVRKKLEKFLGPLIEFLREDTI